MIPESTGPVRVLYDDDDIIVIDKPPGMLTHTNSFERSSPTVITVLGSRFRQSIMNVHRLDRMTTGAMVLARNRSAAAELSRQFRDREVEKSYLAIVRGHIDESGVIETPIPNPTHGEQMHARTDFRRLASGVVDEPIGRYGEGWFSLVELSLHTGRIHQARRHLHRINHPVIGDNKHGDKEWNRWAAARAGERHLYLRACELSFDHPALGTRVEVTLGLPELWLRFMADVGIQAPSRLVREPAVCQRARQ